MKWWHFDGLVQNSINFIANTLELLWSCAKPSTCDYSVSSHAIELVFTEYFSLSTGMDNFCCQNKIQPLKLLWSAMDFIGSSKILNCRKAICITVIYTYHICRKKMLVNMIYLLIFNKLDKHNIFLYCNAMSWALIMMDVSCVLWNVIYQSIWHINLVISIYRKYIATGKCIKLD